VHALFAAKDAKLGILEANFVNLPFRLLNLLEEQGESIADDIARGTINCQIAARISDPAKVAALEAALGGEDGGRAAALREALRSGEPTGLARRIWPKLRLILANATGAFESYAEKLRAGSAAGVPILSTVYAASEGLMGVALSPSLDGRSAYCLVPSAMFFEFLPLSSSGSSSSGSSGVDGGGGGSSHASGDHGGSAVADQTLLAHEVALNTDYELVVTTLGGLCRYRIGDVVRVVGRHGTAPLVEFRYRRGQLLNLRGEKTSEPQLAAALSATFDGRTLMEYTTVEAIPSRGLPFYRIFIERAAGAPALAAGAPATLDAALGRANPIYATWRAKGAIGPCQVFEVAPGSFEALRECRLSEGSSPQQLKVSRVLRSPAHEELLLARVVNLEPRR
jgi:hypothetical protein